MESFRIFTVYQRRVSIQSVLVISACMFYVLTTVAAVLCLCCALFTYVNDLFEAVRVDGVNSRANGGPMLSLSLTRSFSHSHNSVTEFKEILYIQ